MPMDIYSKRLGINRCYIIKADGCIMVDTGPPKSERFIEKWLSTLPIIPHDIRLIVLTHGHADHVGAAMKVKQITGAEIAIHKYDQDLFEQGTMVWPTAVTTWGQVALILMKPFQTLFHFPGGKVDVVLGNKGLSLEEYGIPGSVIHTPGHTPGSVSVLLNSGEAFVGCMTHNNLPFRLKPGLPIFAEDLPKLKDSWRSLLGGGVEIIYPGHGDSFSADVMRKVLF